MGNKTQKIRLYITLISIRVGNYLKENYITIAVIAKHVLSNNFCVDNPITISNP
jgi:hypothetical protein